MGMDSHWHETCYLSGKEAYEHDSFVDTWLEFRYFGNGVSERKSGASNTF